MAGGLRWLGLVDGLVVSGLFWVGFLGGGFVCCVVGLVGCLLYVGLCVGFLGCLVVFVFCGVGII